MPTARINLPAGTYTGDRPGTVPVLTGSITQDSLVVGQTATLTTNASPNSTYQWRLGGSNIPGATAASLPVANAGALTCVIVSGAQSVTTAEVTVGAAGVLSISPDFDGELLLTVEESGNFTITITSDTAHPQRAAYNEGAGPGVYVRDPALFAGGPVLLYPGLIAGTPAVGGALAMIVPPLWAASPDPTFTPVYQWASDVAGDGVFADLSGQTNPASLVIGANEATDQVRLSHSATDSRGTRSGVTNTLLVEAAAATTVTPTTDGADFEDLPDIAPFTVITPTSNGFVMSVGA